MNGQYEIFGSDVWARARLMGAAWLVGMLGACARLGEGKPMGPTETGSGEVATDRGAADEVAATTPTPREPVDAVATEDRGFAVHLGKPVTLSDGRELVLVSLSVESSQAAPDAPERGGVNVNLTLGGWPLELTWFADGEKSAVAWRADVEVRVLAVSDDARSATVRVTQWEIPGTAPTHGPFRLDADQRVETGAGIAVTFLRHSHKSMDPSDKGPGPLGVGLLYEADGESERDSTWVDLDGDRRWSWRSWFFQLVDHEYDKFTTIRVGRCVPNTMTDR